MDRESARKQGWQYEKSNHGLFPEFAFRETPAGVEVYTSDKVHYAPEEVALLKDCAFPAPVHLVKKVFQGSIIVPEKERGNDK
jgi:hypothetical protein